MDSLVAAIVKLCSSLSLSLSLSDSRYLCVFNVRRVGFVQGIKVLSAHLSYSAGSYFGLYFGPTWWISAPKTPLLHNPTPDGAGVGFFLQDIFLF
jgi:hypothetical protein